MLVLCSYLSWFVHVRVCTSSVDQVMMKVKIAPTQELPSSNASSKSPTRPMTCSYDYKTVTKVVDGLMTYNQLLQRQVDNQEAEKAALSESIDNVALIERQICQ